MIVRLSNSRKTRYFVNLASTNSWGRFHYIFLPCSTFILYIKKGNIGEKFAFTTLYHHKGISIWVLTQQVTSIVNAIIENIASFVLFHTPLANNVKIIFKTYADQLTSDSDHQEHLTVLIASGKQRKWFDKISLMSKGKSYCKAQEWGSFTSCLHATSYKMEITEDEQQAVADVTNYHQGWTHKWFRSSRASNYSHCKWKAKKMIRQDLTHVKRKKLLQSSRVRIIHISSSLYVL